MAQNKLKTNFKVLLIGGSAGSLEVLMRLFPRFSSLDSLAIVIVLHRKNTEDSLLEELFEMKTQIPVKEVEDKVELQPSFLYIAPADYHLLFEKNGRLSLDTSEKVNFSRPSIDVSFESAAEVYGENLTAILLSGANTDGTEGLKMIKELGGTIVVQKPEDSKMPFMPQNAIFNTSPDFILSEQQIFELIVKINQN